ncbi:MAG: hypothetical protein IKX89_01805 [Firmicutes bacterium]|nr:hypothetical protein [Bacillota bacterium]
MKKSTALISGISRSAFAAAVFCAFEGFFALVAEVPDAYISPVWPFLCFGILFAFGSLARAREMRPLVYTGLVIIIAAAGLAALQLLFDVPGDALRFRALMSLCFAIDAAVIARSAVSDSTTAVYTHRFDACMIVLMLTMLAGHYLNVRAVPSAMVMSLTALVLLLAAVTASRIEKNGASGSRAGALILIVLFIAVAAAALLAGVFGTAGAGSAAAGIVSGIRAVFGAIGAGLAFVWSQWKRFCAWIATFFEPGEYVPSDIEVPDDPQDLPEPAELSHASAVVFYVLTALVIAAVLYAVIRALSRARFRRSRGHKADNRTAVRSGGMWASLKEMMGELKRRISYRAACIRYRSTPAGLLAWCEARSRGRLRKLPSESGEAFLRRLAVHCTEEDRAALLRLSDLVEQSFYGREEPVVDAALCKAVRSCSFSSAGFAKQAE